MPAEGSNDMEVDARSSGFGGLLRRHRLAAGLSQEALAESARLSADGISALERGSRRSPQRETVALLIEALTLEGDRRREFEDAARTAARRGCRANQTARPNNLPSEVSSFVNRRREVAELRELLRSRRLVTIAGLGGMGKTRLALHVAGEVVASFDDGAWFVELISTSNPALVANAVAGALGIREVQGATIEQTLLQHLRTKRMLLILDNCEHLLEGVASLAKTIASQCASVILLMTSREPLHVIGEHVYRLESLADVPEYADISQLLVHDAVRLFFDRAAAVAPGFDVTPSDAGELAGICRRLQGIPLAIELAAARTSTLSLRQLNQRLDGQLAILTSSDRTLERHRTLAATIEWSYQLLRPQEQAVFAKLFVFSGGFTLDACEHVVGEDAMPVVDVLQSLVEKSLVYVRAGETSRRFAMLDAVRAFACARLGQIEGVDAAIRAHARYYAEFAASGVDAVGPDAIEFQRALDDEGHNLRTAFDWCLENDVTPGARLALNLCTHWRIRGTITVARTWLTALLGKDGIPPSDRNAVLLQAAVFAMLQDDLTAALAYANEASSAYSHSGDVRGCGEALLRIAQAEHRKGRLDEAKRCYEDALKLSHEAGDRFAETRCIGNLGMLARQRGDYALANDLLEKARRRAAAGAQTQIADELCIHLCIHLGWVSLCLGQLSKSEELFEEVREHSVVRGDPYEMCAAQLGLGTVDLQAGRLSDAYEAFASTVATAYDLRLQDYVFRGMYGLSAVFTLRGDLPAGARYMGLAERAFAQTDRELRDDVAYDVARQALSALPEADRRRWITEGRAMRIEEIITQLRSEGIVPA